MSEKVTRLRAAWVVGYRDGDHCLLADGEVVWQGERILFVGFDYPGEVDEEINAGNCLVGPGFIDLDALGDLDTTVLAFDNQPGWKKGASLPLTGSAATSTAASSLTSPSIMPTAICCLTASPALRPSPRFSIANGPKMLMNTCTPQMWPNH